MKKLLLAFLVCAMIAAIGCSSMGKGGKQSIVGTWEGSTPNGDSITMVFSEDNTMSTTFSGNQSFTISAKYKIDYSTTPVSFDSFDFDADQLDGVKYLGIIKFTKTDTMLLRGTMIRSGESGNRPTNFNDEAIELERKK